MTRSAIALVAPSLLAGTLGAAIAQPPDPARRYTGPIFDVHIHTTAPAGWGGRPNPVTGVPAPATEAEHRSAVLAAMKQHNIVRAVLHGPPATLDAWTKAAPGVFLPSPMLYDPPDAAIPTPESLREGIRQGRYAGIGEIIAQYAGVALDDPELVPYWRLAQELDVPVAVHTGRSFPGIMYEGYPKFRLRFGNPLGLEDALAAHPRLRAYIMHGGEPWRQDTMAMMSMYPQLHMDVGAIAWLMPRPAFHGFLREMVGRGLGKRIMFGTDEMAWPDAIGLAIENVDSADFLTPEQKADIFHDNAKRFFRIGG
jgi:predicted TIM-barrel fold metal-dependent hydrolase